MHNSDKENQTNPPVSADNELNDGLSALWQAQPVTTINLEGVKANLGSERTKQRWYIILDLLMGVVLQFLFSHFGGTLLLLLFYLVCSTINHLLDLILET